MVIKYAFWCFIDINFQLIAYEVREGDIYISFPGAETLSLESRHIIPSPFDFNNDERECLLYVLCMSSIIYFSLQVSVSY